MSIVIAQKCLLYFTGCVTTDKSLPLSGPQCPPSVDLPRRPPALVLQESTCGSLRPWGTYISIPTLPTPPRPPLGILPAESYRDEATVEVEALAAALGHHDAGAPGPVLAGRQREEQQVEAREGRQAEQVAAVVVPVGPGQSARAARAARGGGGRQPVGSAARDGLCSGQLRRGTGPGGHRGTPRPLPSTPCPGPRGKPGTERPSHWPRVTQLGKARMELPPA